MLSRVNEAFSKVTVDWTFSFDNAKLLFSKESDAFALPKPYSNSSVRLFEVRYLDTMCIYVLHDEAISEQLAIKLEIIGPQSNVAAVEISAINSPYVKSYRTGGKVREKSSTIQKWFAESGQVHVRCTIESSTEANEVSEMEKMFENETHADLTIYCGHEAIKASKSILCAQSEKFKSIIEKQKGKDFEDILVIDNISYEVLRALVKFLYTLNIDIQSVPFALAVHEAAEKFKIKALQDLCEDYLCLNIDHASALEILQRGKSHKSEKLLSSAIKFITTKQWDQLDELPGWTELNAPDLLRLIITAFAAKCSSQNPQKSDQRIVELSERFLCLSML